MDKECPNCFQGKTVKPEKAEEADKLYDSGICNYYEAILRVGTNNCPKCNGTGRLRNN